MKKNMRNLIYAAVFFLTFSLAGCHYLDVDPELGITEEEVFSTYSSANSFLSLAYDANWGQNKVNISLAYPLYMEFLQDFYFSWAATTDAADAGRLGYAQRNFKQGYLSQDIIKQYSFSSEQTDKPIGTAMFGVIRIANKLIEQFPNIKIGTEKELNDLLGQAYFLRGLAHFNLCRYFGGMPYIDYVIGADDEWDIPRLSAYETYVKAADDLNLAYTYLQKAGYMRRNTPTNLVPGNNTLEIMKPSGCLALAMRARCLLYAASPLNNVNGIADWEIAAEAAGVALKAALDNNYKLQDMEFYTNNYTGVQLTNEIIWGYHINISANEQNMAGLLSYCQSKFSSLKGSSGLHPTQNFVDRFETADGYMLRTEEERQIAAAAGSYNEQNPYANRDPRMDMVIIHDGSPAFDQAAVAGGVFNIYYDPSVRRWPVTNLNGTNFNYGIDWGSGDNNTQGASNTGYYCRRYWNGSFGFYYCLDPMFRLGEMYLAYAEAVNEAKGPSGTAGGMDITALEAVNVVRNRVGMPPVRDEYKADADTFRDYIRNERCVETAFESNHYYFDIRRWKLAPELMNSTLYGMYVEKCEVSATYPVGRKYIRKPIPNNRQSLWRDYMYVLPFPDNQANTMKNFVNNPKWQ